jgi:hypothetical protein
VSSMWMAVTWASASRASRGPTLSGEVVMRENLL